MMFTLLSLHSVTGKKNGETKEGNAPADAAAAAAGEQAAKPEPTEQEKLITKQQEDIANLTVRTCFVRTHMKVKPLNETTDQFLLACHDCRLR